MSILAVIFLTCVFGLVVVGLTDEMDSATGTTLSVVGSTAALALAIATLA